MDALDIQEGFVEEYAANPLQITVEDSEALRDRLGIGGYRYLTQTTIHTKWALGTTARVKLAAQHYPEWAGKILKAWRKFMPTRYRESAWPRYQFDIPPLRALKAIEAANALGIFDRMEIWTPENQRIRRGFWRWLNEEHDPVCVGIVDGHIFPIVRWGKDELVSERSVGFRGHFLYDPDHRPRYHMWGQHYPDYDRR